MRKGEREEREMIEVERESKMHRYAIVHCILCTVYNMCVVHKMWSICICSIDIYERYTVLCNICMCYTHTHQDIARVTYCLYKKGEGEKGGS